jgi:hypothetical protein
MDALGDGWLAKLFLACLAGAGGWIMRRPTERAALVTAIDTRINSFLNRQDVEIEHLRKQIVEDRKLCDQQLKDLEDKLAASREERILQIKDLQDQLIVRKWPREPDSNGIIGGEDLK